MADSGEGGGTVLYMGDTFWRAQNRLVDSRQMGIRPAQFFSSLLVQLLYGMTVEVMIMMDYFFEVPLMLP